MKIEILSGSYVMDEEVKPYITVADETAIAAISQKIAIRQRREAEKEEQKRQKEEGRKRVERKVLNHMLSERYEGGYEDYE